MNKIACLSLVIVLAAVCSSKKEDDLIHFDNSTVYAIINEAGAADPTWSPDMSTIVYTFRGDLWSVPPEGGELTKVTSLTGNELYPNWSPVSGSKEIVFVNTTGPEDYTIYVLSYGQGEPRAVKTFSNQVLFTSWSRDGSKIVFLQLAKKGIFTIPAEGGEPVPITNNQGWESVEFAQASPARDMVLYISHVGTDFYLNEISLSGGDPNTIASFSGGREYPRSLAESYDGTLVAYTSPGIRPGYNVYLVPLKGGNRIQVTAFSYAQLNNPSWSSDGKKLVAQFDQGLYIVELKEGIIP